ncbi:penicillin-binding protein [Clostridium autoethanogenum]|uniref:Penicillin-binding protein n=1 Tax=Clostridium autoethanogenum TaxID=84023 RepID=A0A3M0SJI2_9CLOT|nr:penicillin-binding transpeptidase domain-containing protein [Clostridium autoethanogenum]RMC98573.1 penicillin-binding protein [Clostridium autoethanogenum]
MNEKKRFSITRYTILIAIMIIIFSTIIIRLFFLQVVQGAEYKEKASNKSIKEISDIAPRGQILDSKGNILAASTQGYMLIYNQTDNQDKVFFSTMNKVFKILDDSGESQQDDFELKVNPYRFEFRSDDEDTRKNLEIKFKRDRGLNEELEKNIKKKSKNIPDDELKVQVNKELLNMSPEDTFKKLMKRYGISNTYPLEQQRRLMIVKDTLKMNSFSGYKPVIVASNIKKETAFKFLQILNELPGMDVTTEPIRSYPNGDLGSNFLGYISKISSSYERYTEKGYNVNSDYVGQAGIEGALEDRLKGSKGGRIVKLDKNGKITEELGKKESCPGQTVQLTIDTNVQKAAENSLESTLAYLRSNPNEQQGSNTSNATRGEAVAVNVNTGAIIAMAQVPRYDPNLFTVPGKLSSEMYDEYFNPNLEQFGRKYIETRGITANYPGESEDEVLNELFPIDKSIKNNSTIRKDVYDIYPKPFYNYATQSLIPPGSTFKPITAIAGLETGVITPDFTVDDQGKFDQGGKIVEFKSDGPQGVVNLISAIEKSSNPYFMTVAEKLRNALGDNILAKYAWKFGLGIDPNSSVKAATGIEIPEKFGQVYNTVSNKTAYASTYLWKTMSVLKNGQDDYGHKIVTIDLYDNDNDSKETTQIKNYIKNLIKDCIKNGTSSFDKSKYKELFSELTSKAVNTKRDISDSQMNSLINAIYSITISDANDQLKVPANIEDAAIGQGLNQFTPLQIVNYVATLANGGTRYKLHLVDQYLDTDGKVIEKIKPEVMKKTGVSAANLESVKEGMNAVNENGTAAHVFNGFPKSTAGKTGTAQSLGNQEQVGRTDYAEYIGFAPSDKPEIAVCVVLFDGGHGGVGAASVAKDIYSSYFNINNKIK